jgi:hypothetical protein
MPIPAIAAISAAAGLGSAVIGARASNRASNAQTDSANQQIGLQADMFNRMDDVQRRLYGAQRDTIQGNTAGAQRTAGNAYDVAAGQARNLRDAGLTNATDTRDQNAGLNRNALRASSARTRDNQFDTIRDNNATYGRGMGLAGRTMDANIGDFRRERAAGTEQLWQDRADNVGDFRRERAAGTRQLWEDRADNIGDARRERAAGTKQLWADRRDNLDTYDQEKRASLGYFQPSIGRGNDAGAAYSYNLGLGGKPKGYSGLQESEGTKYLMNTGRQEIEGGAAGNGNMYSGATLAALDKKRMGLASLDKDNQMQQLMAQAGLGQSAANSAAGIRAGYADDAAATRSGATSSINALRGAYTGQISDARNAATAGINNLRAGYTGQIAGARNAATAGINNLRSQYTGDIADERGDYRNTANLLDQTRGAGNTAARNLGTGTLNQLQDTYANRGIGINNAYNANSYGINSDFANANTNAADTLAARRTDAFNNNTANLGAARANRANLMGGNAANYTSGMSSAIANKGDARAAGVIGGANALMGGIQNGLGMYGMMGGQFGGGGGGVQPQVPANGTNVFANNNPFANPFANFSSWFK